MTATPDTSTRKVGTPLSQAETIASLSRYGYGWVDSDVAGASAKRGLSDDVVRDIRSTRLCHEGSPSRCVDSSMVCA